MSADPNVMMIDANIFNSMQYDALSTDAKLYYAKMLANCNRLGVADFYSVWKEIGMQNAKIFNELFASELVLDVNAMIAFVPDVFRANQHFMTKKYKTSIDLKSFALCMSKYPQYLSLLGTTQKKWIMAHGMVLTNEMLPFFGDCKELAMDNREGTKQIVMNNSVSTEAMPRDGGRSYVLNGVVISDMDAGDYQKLQNMARQFNIRHGSTVMSPNEVMDWYLAKHSDHYTYDGERINNIKVLFESYLEGVYRNKKASGTLTGLEYV